MKKETVKLIFFFNFKVEEMYRCEKCGEPIYVLTAKCKIEPDFGNRGWKYYCEECTEILFDEEASFQKTTSLFENIGVKIVFRNPKNKVDSISARCTIRFTEKTMNIQAKKLAASLNENIAKNIAIPEIVEANLYQIKDLAKEMKVPWWWLMDITFDLKNIAVQGFDFRLGWRSSTNLGLLVKSPQGDIHIELMKQRANTRVPSEKLRQISNIIKKYNKD